MTLLVHARILYGLGAMALALGHPDVGHALGHKWPEDGHVAINGRGRYRGAFRPHPPFGGHLWPREPRVANGAGGAGLPGLGHKWPGNDTSGAARGDEGDEAARGGVSARCLRPPGRSRLKRSALCGKKTSTGGDVTRPTTLSCAC